MMDGSRDPPGGGAAGFKKREPEPSRDQNQDQDQDQDQEPASRTSSSFFFFVSVSRLLTTGMRCSRCPAAAAVLVVLVASALDAAASQPDRDQDRFQDQDLDLELRQHRLLQKARSAGLLSQEWSKRAVEDLLAQMSLPEPESQREAEVVSMATGGRMNLERSVDPPNSIPPRDRKAGCKNFYWKGFTSC